MKFSWIRALVAVAVLAASGFEAAHADIKGFNAAMKAGDYKTAAAQAEDTWKTWNTADEQTAVLAREFGFAALMGGRNDLAKQFGEFLVQKGATLQTPDDQPATSAVLLRIAEFRLNRGEVERTALRSALLARSAAPGVDMTSALSWQSLYLADWVAGEWEIAERDSVAAAEYMKRQGALLNRQRDAEIVGGAARFLVNRNRLTKSRNDLYHDMANLHDAIAADIDAASSPVMRNELFNAKWKAEAWTMAIESYLTSTYSQIGSNISLDLNTRPLMQPAAAPFAEDPAAAQRPLCAGKFQGRKLVYPASKEWQGLVGSVITNMETDASGKVIKAQVLSAVPLKSFSAQVVDALKTWTYKPVAGANTSACRLNSRNHVFKVIFRME